MHTPVEAPCCYKLVQPPHRVEQVFRHRLQRGLGETSRDPLAVELAANAGEGGVAGRLGGVEGGAGGFCANVTGSRSGTASASKANIRMQWLIDLFLGRERPSRKFRAQVSSGQAF